MRPGSGDAPQPDPGRNLETPPVAIRATVGYDESQSQSSAATSPEVL